MVALLVLGAGAARWWRSRPPDSWACGGVGTTSPDFATADEAFAWWWAAPGPGSFAVLAPGVAVPDRAAWTRSEQGNPQGTVTFEAQVDDRTRLDVDVQQGGVAAPTGRWAVTGQGACTRQ